MTRIAPLAIALLLAANAALAAPAMTAETATGAILTAPDGKSLYTFDKDAPGTSNCAGDCVVNWPILAAAATDKAEGDYTIIDRADGARQWAYKGLPLYTFFKDAAAGDTLGDGVKGVWHLARP